MKTSSVRSMQLPPTPLKNIGKDFIPIRSIVYKKQYVDIAALKDRRENRQLRLSLPELGGSTISKFYYSNFADV